MIQVFLSVGSNEGDRLRSLATAYWKLNESAGRVDAISSIYETEPWGFKAETYFLNQVIRLNTQLPAGHLMSLLLEIEAGMGRQRKEPGYHSRCIDLDILFYGERILHTDRLEVPHPRLHERRFILVPLNEIAPDFIHPLLGQSISTLLLNCSDETRVTGFLGSTEAAQHFMEHRT